MKEQKQIILFYAKIPYDKYTSVEDLLPDKYKFKLTDDNKYYIGLYAWADNRKIANEFFKSRDKGIYKVQTIFVDLDEYNKFRLDYINYKIDKYEYDSNDDSVEMYTTKYENTLVNDYGEECLNTVIDEACKFDYTLFNKEIQQVLDVLSYTTYFDTSTHDFINPLNDISEIEERIEYANYQRSYYLTNDGNRFLELSKNKLLVLLYLFTPLFINYEKE